MPRLKKHSQLQKTQIEEKTEEDAKYQEQTEVQQADKSSPENLPIRMKYSDRKKAMVKPKSQKKSKKEKSEPKCKVEVQESPAEAKEDSNINIFLNKYTDDDDIDEIEDLRQVGRRKSQKLLKPQIKIKNKMFSNVDFEDTLEQQKLEQHQQLDISIEKREKRDSGQFLDKFQRKALTYKNKLEYKDLNKDHKYQRNIQSKLKQIRQVEEVNIQIEVPKIFTGNRPQVEAAIFLKNAGDSTQQVNDKINTQKQEEETSACIDRKMYYEELGKQMRVKKAQTYTQSMLKERFKTSMLNEEDYIEDFDDRTVNGYDRGQSNWSRPVKQRTQSRQRSLEGKQVDRQSNKMKKTVSGDSNLVASSLNHSRLSSKQSLEKQPAPQPEKQLTNADNNPIIYRKKKESQNIKKKIKTFKYNNLIEVQAQLSDDEQQGGPKHQDEPESDIEDSDEVDSLIDDNSHIGHNDRHVLQKKFIADMIEEQNKKYEEMKKKIEKKYLEEQEMIKKRMEEAAKKNMEKDEQDDILYYADNILDEHSASAATSKSTTMKGKDQEKLKELEEMLGNDKKKKLIQPYKLGAKSTTSSLQALEKSVFGGAAKVQKAERKGMKNANVHKKPIVIKGTK